MRECSVHGIALKPGRQEIRRGMPPAPPEGYFEAAGTLFPAARSFEIGGCLVGPDDEDDQKVKFCPKCREVEQSWFAEHPASKFWRP